MVKNYITSIHFYLEEKNVNVILLNIQGRTIKDSVYFYFVLLYPIADLIKSLGYLIGALF